MVTLAEECGGFSAPISIGSSCRLRYVSARSVSRAAACRVVSTSGQCLHQGSVYIRAVSKSAGIMSCTNFLAIVSNTRLRAKAPVSMT